MSKFDLHIHSCYSTNLCGTVLFGPPSRALPEDIIKTALERGLDIIAVTDHNNVLGGQRTAEIAENKYKNEILVVRGVEIASKDGDIIGINVQKNIPKGLSAAETIFLIKKQGGHAIIPHPFNVKFSLSRKKVIEVQSEILALEGANSHALKNKEVQGYAAQNKIPMSAGSDAHGLREIGLCYGETEKKIRNLDDLLQAIVARDVKLHTYNKKLLRRVVPNGITTFLHWKRQQLKRLFNKKTFLPYKEPAPEAIFLK